MSEVQQNKPRFFEKGGFYNTPDGSCSFYVENGLNVKILPLSENLTFHLQETSRDITIPAGTRVAQVEFFPFPEDGYIPGARTQALALGIKAIENFFVTLYTQNPNADETLPFPEYLIGGSVDKEVGTNPRMAQFARKLGFEIDHSDPNNLLLIAKTEEVAKKVAELTRNRAKVNQLMEKAKREYNRGKIKRIWD